MSVVCGNMSEEDEFGPPHPQTVSESLQLWILIPGLIGLIFIGKNVVHVSY